MRSLSDDVRDVFKDIDPLLWQERETTYKEQQNKVLETAERRKTDRSRNYALLKQLASKRKAELLAKGADLPADCPEEEKGDLTLPPEDQKATESKDPPTDGPKPPLSIDPGPADENPKQDGPVNPSALENPTSAGALENPTAAASRPPASEPDPAPPANPVDGQTRSAAEAATGARGPASGDGSQTPEVELLDVAELAPSPTSLPAPKREPSSNGLPPG